MGQLERNVVVQPSEARRWRQRTFGQWQVGDDVQIEDVLAVHEHHLGPLCGIEPLPQPVSGLLSDLTAGNNEGVINEHAAIELWIEYLVTEHHRDLVEDLGDRIGCDMA